jgi:hypothetical protein
MVAVTASRHRADTWAEAHRIRAGNLAAINVGIRAGEVAYPADVFEPTRVPGERHAPTHFAHAEPARQH